MVTVSDMQKWQDAVKGINDSAKADLSEEESLALNTLVSLFNSGDFESGESGDYIQTLKKALPQHANNRLLKVHLTNFVALCEKYFKAQPAPAVSQPLVVQQPYAEKEFYYFDCNEQKGPVGINQLKSLGLMPETLVWTEGFDEWKPAKDVAELKTLFGKIPPPPQIITNTSGRTKKSGNVFIKAIIIVGIILAGGYFVVNKSGWFGNSSGGISVNTDDGADVYVVGIMDNTSVLWKNGVAQYLIDNGTWSVANSVFVSGSDVYAAITEDNPSGIPFAALWKNGVMQYLSEGSGSYSWANSVFVSGADVYVAGSIDNRAVVWKNGTAQMFGIGSCNSVFVQGGDVYVAGEMNGDAVLWKNGIAQNLTSGRGAAKATSVYVSGSNVYVTGTQDEWEGAGSYQYLWINGERHSLETSEANSVFVSGNDVYVAGGYQLWKNGEIQQLAEGQAYSVFVAGGDVYVAGHIGSNRAVLWKNGVMQTLGSGSSAEAISVFVVQRNVVAETRPQSQPQAEPVQPSISGRFPQASERLLTAADVQNLSKEDLQIMRNEIFARHGFIFQTQAMRTYFQNQSWYVPRHNDVNSLLTSIEKENIELISRYE